MPAPDPSEYRPPNQPEASWAWPVIWLVLVLLLACGGLVLAWRLIG
jgi:hypothetical protein